MQNDIGQLSHGYEKIIVSNNFSLLKMIRQCLDQIGPANLKITTFQTSDEFLRSMLILKKKGLVLRNTLITNSLHLTKMIHNEKLMNNVYDEVFMVRNHSKIVLMENEKWKIAILTSQNQSFGYNFEFYYITTDGQKFATLDAEFENIKTKAFKSNVVRTETNN